MRRRRCPVQEAGPRISPGARGGGPVKGHANASKEVTAPSGVAVDSAGRRCAGISPRPMSKDLRCRCRPDMTKNVGEDGSTWSGKPRNVGSRRFGHRPAQRQQAGHHRERVQQATTITCTAPARSLRRRDSPWHSIAATVRVTARVHNPAATTGGGWEGWEEGEGWVGAEWLTRAKAGPRGPDLGAPSSAARCSGRQPP